jgi:hypothetical protein
MLSPQSTSNERGYRKNAQTFPTSRALALFILGLAPRLFFGAIDRIQQFVVLEILKEFHLHTAWPDYHPPAPIHTHGLRRLVGVYPWLSVKAGWFDTR